MVVAIFNVSQNGHSAKKYEERWVCKKCSMLDLKYIGSKKVVQEFDEVENNYWFNFSQRKFLHNIDTFYYSVKFANDFTSNSKDNAVKRFRKHFEMLYKCMEDGNKYSSSIDFHIPNLPSTLNLKPFTFAGFFSICLECPDYFDVFFAPVVPHASEGEESVTCECIVQIRSYMLWMYGVKLAYERSYEYIKVIAEHFNLDIKFTQENRIDYCWHSNYLANPEKFFTLENFHKMRVDRFKDALFHTSKVGSEDYEVDYIALGKRSDKVFIRIYLKSKEVIEKGYKPWFFKVWLLNGLINHYDFYVYEYAFLQRSWKAIDKGRIAFYAEYGRDIPKRDYCQAILDGEVDISADKLRDLADELTPKVNLIINVEYQTMRKHSKNYCLLPFFDNTDKLTSKRIYDYLDNRKLICDYLTSKVFRLVEPHSPGKNDSNKSRRECCGFWKALQSCKLTDCYVPDEERELVRTYSRKLNSELVKARAVKAAVTFGIYTRGINSDNPLQDCIEALCMMNDNDMQDAIRFKQKKIRQFNESELADTMNNYLVRPDRFIIIDKESGEVYNNYTPDI